MERIARNLKDIPEDSIQFFGAGYSPTFLTQIAYEHFIRKCKLYNTTDRLLANEYWARIVHESLYQDCDQSIDNILNSHPYLRQLARLAFKCPQIVTFNFDNLLSEAMQVHASEVAKTGGHLVPPDISVKPGLIDKPGAPTIFHINGLLPRNLQRKRSEHLVFTENAFADAMLSTNSLEFNHILFNLSNYTNLIIGHSLNDSSLKNLLRGSRQRAPAQLNYFISWVDEKEPPNDQVMQDIFAVNLEVYNLITIFATTSDIAEILKLINITEEIDFAAALRPFGISSIKYLYYIVGPVASGKTSVLLHLRYFQTYEEWLDPVPPLMYLSHNLLTDEQRSDVEKWVLDQLDKKNRIMQRTEAGFYFMDRAPLDALVFSATEEERRKKACALSKCFQADNQLTNAQIQFIYAEGKALEERNIRRGRLPEQGGDSDYIDKQTNDLLTLYTPDKIYDATNKSSGEIAREIVISTLLDDYEEKNLGSILEEETNEI